MKFEEAIKMVGKQYIQEEIKCREENDITIKLPVRFRTSRQDPIRNTDGESIYKADSVNVTARGRLYRWNDSGIQ